MKAGRELDALVAEKVMGWQHVHKNRIGNLVGREPGREAWDYPVPFYSLSIGSTWDIVEKLQSPDCAITVYASYDGDFIATVHRGDLLDSFDARAETAPHAVCLAALRAVGVEL